MVEGARLEIVYAPSVSGVRIPPSPPRNATPSWGRFAWRSWATENPVFCVAKGVRWSERRQRKREAFSLAKERSDIPRPKNRGLWVFVSSIMPVLFIFLASSYTQSKEMYHL